MKECKKCKKVKWDSKFFIIKDYNYVPGGYFFEETWLCNDCADKIGNKAKEDYWRKLKEKI